MSVKERHLAQIDRVLFRLKERERATQLPAQKWLYRASSWLSELYYEIIKNDVAIRAESLSYFTLFSIMPLIAGVFLLLGVISQYAPVQKEFEELLANFLQAIPDEQRDVLLDFILQFKDDYLAKISKQSATLGIFALGVLIWVVGKVFFNLESLMNGIWAVNYERPFLERIQNFVFCMVILPIAYIVALSLPGVIEHFGQKQVGVVLHHGIPIFIIYFSLGFIFRYFPNTKVSWRSANLGALVSTLALGIANFLLGFYFRFGTSTAYGKAAILPIFAFFIYITWWIFILGVEVSLLAQTPRRHQSTRLPTTNLVQALILEKVLQLLEERFQKQGGALALSEMLSQIAVPFDDLEQVLSFLSRQGAVLRIEKTRSHEYAYVLARSTNELDLIQLIKEYLNLSQIDQRFDVFSLLKRINQS